jgi:hypothetical protein
LFLHERGEQLSASGVGGIDDERAVVPGGHRSADHDAAGDHRAPRCGCAHRSHHAFPGQASGDGARERIDHEPPLPVPVELFGGVSWAPERFAIRTGM